MIENAGIRNLARGEPFPGFDEALGSAGARVGRALTTAPGLIKNYTGYLAEARGKMIRAASLLACAQAPDGTVPPTQCALRCRWSFCTWRHWCMTT